MQFLKKYEDIKFYGDRENGDLEVSEDIVMASAAGWYVGSICHDPDVHYHPVPYDRQSFYFETPEEAQSYLDGIKELFPAPTYTCGTE